MRMFSRVYFQGGRRNNEAALRQPHSLAHAAQNRCFGCGEANPQGLQLEFLLAQDGTVVCPATIPDIFEGHPGFLHGGIIATLLDETMSKAVRARGLTAMTRHMEVDYKRPVPSCVADSHGGANREGRRAQTLGRSYDIRRRWTCARPGQRAIY